METKNLTLIFSHFEKEHLGKDVFLVPYYLGKSLGYDTDIVYQKTKTNHSKYHRGVRLIPLKNLFFLPQLKALSFFLRSLGYVISNGRKINLLMTFHFRLKSAVLCFFYKIANPDGQFYLKVDDEKDILHSRLSLLKKIFYKKFLVRIDYLSVETHAAYRLWKENKTVNTNLSQKLFLVENGFDEDTLKELRISVLPFAQKENIIITVGRLGTYEKNTEMFLQAIENIKDMKNWKFCLIGSIENGFQKRIEDFFIKNPHLRDIVKFTRAIYDKKMLWEYYNRAKVFVLTSRWESYGLVLNEAYRFNNYIISTYVGAAEEILSKNNSFGKLIEQDNPTQLTHILEDFINDKNSFNYSDKNHANNSWENCLMPLIKAMKFHDFDNKGCFPLQCGVVIKNNN